MTTFSTFKIKIVLLFFLSISLPFGCAKKELYRWEGYSKSLYHYKKTPEEKSYGHHKQILEKIIEESSRNNARVPPGIYCEYALMLMKAGNHEESLKYLDLEEKIYPESKIFVTSLKNMINAKRKSKEPSQNTETK